MSERDRRALKVLFDAYWSSAGWKDSVQISPDDFAYARAAGYVFDPVEKSHTDLVAWVRESRSKVSAREVADAFVASLSTRRLDWRSALGSYGYARNFPNHPFTIDPPISFSGRLCTLCGKYPEVKVDLTVLNFERHKWGGVRHDDPAYVGFDLEQFRRLDVTKPTAKDRDILRKVLRKADGLSSRAKVSDLERAIAPFFESNRNERRIVLDILGLCGVLQPKAHAGYFEGYPGFAEREFDLPPAPKLDWRYPVCWWRGADGLHGPAVDHYFGPYV